MQFTDIFLKLFILWGNEAKLRQVAVSVLIWVEITKLRCYSNTQTLLKQLSIEKEVVIPDVKSDEPEVITGLSILPHVDIQHHWKI